MLSRCRLVGHEFDLGESYFESMPELHWAHGYKVFWAVAFTLVAVLLYKLL